MPVDTQHNEYTANSGKWSVMRDCMAGEDAVKAARNQYLPYFIPHDEARYGQYVQRANYVNVTGRTLKGLVGAIFRRAPQINLPPQLEYLLEDFDGTGQSLDQLGKEICTDLMTTGRYGLLVDYPQAEAGLSAEDVDSRKLRATIATYGAEDIINWRTVAMGGQLILVMVVLRESAEVQVDQFEFIPETRYRVLSLDEGVYVQRVFNDDGEQVVDDVFPRKADGSLWREIPFQFVGASDNRPSVDTPPLYDLARVNLAHYRNSADLEESLYVHGQGTLFVSSELSVEQWQEANPGGIRVGARTGHFIGAGGKAELLQIQANTAVREAMLDKEDTMRSIGARLISQNAKNQTAEAARIDASAEASVLSVIAGNASEAIESALEYAAGFMGGDPDQVKFALNQSFFDESMTAQDVMALIALEDRRTIGRTDVRAKMRATGWIAENRTDEDLDAELSEV